MACTQTSFSTLHLWHLVLVKDLTQQTWLEASGLGQVFPHERSTQFVPGSVSLAAIPFCVSENEEAIQYRGDKLPPVPRSLPPHNRFGDPEDAIQNCKFLIPKAPKKDFLKFYEKDR